MRWGNFPIPAPWATLMVWQTHTSPSLKKLKMVPSLDNWVYRGAVSGENWVWSGRREAEVQRCKGQDSSHIEAVLKQFIRKH